MISNRRPERRVRARRLRQRR